MKKLFLLILFAFILTGCTLPIGIGESNNNNSTNVETTTDSLLQLDQEDLDNIKQQIMDEIRQEIQDEYAQRLTETEHMIINMVKANTRGVLGVSNFQKTLNTYREVSTGSGVIYKHENNEYYVITNEHVIKDADKIRVVLPDWTYIDAELVGDDPVTDIAVIKFTSTSSFPVIEFADSESLQIGQFAIAIGNPLGYDYYGSVTSGIVSGLSRNLDIDYDEDGIIDWNATLIQHDAAISPGNSGGGLFDISGKLIGINNMKIVENTVSNIGFAIPSNTVQYIKDQLEEYGNVVRPSLGITGIGVAQIISNNEIIQETDNDYLNNPDYIHLPDGVTIGVYVSTIVENSSSANSDLQPEDIIIKYNDIDIIVFDDLRLQIDNAKIGDHVVLTVNRNGSIVEIPITLIKRPNL